MACFLVPTAEAVITTVAAKAVRKKEAKSPEQQTDKPKLSEKLGLLNNMLWGGSGLLAFEHVWHGEVQPFFPFLTAASDPESTAEMLTEMATSGTAMAAVVTLAWAGIVTASGMIRKRTAAKAASEGASA